LKQILPVRGEHFEGRLDNQGHAVGFALYYNKVKDDCTLFIGRCKGVNP
jgi:hypothetical protein